MQKTSFFRLFQSTPPRRRRQGAYSGFASLKDFNPRLREGGDLLHAKDIILQTISIHASAKEATKRHRGNGQGHDKISIHASAKEATAVTDLAFAALCDFNPRLREGGDN